MTSITPFSGSITMSPRPSPSTNRCFPMREYRDRQRLHGEAELRRQKFHALNGGPTYKVQRSGISSSSASKPGTGRLLLEQADRRRRPESKCGWPRTNSACPGRSCLRRSAVTLGDPDRQKSDRAMQAMMKMQKIIIADLDRPTPADPAHPQHIRVALRRHPLFIGPTMSASMTTAADTGSTSDDGSGHHARVFNAPRDLVFRLWTDPRHALNWWGPRDHPASTWRWTCGPAANGATACARPRTAASSGTTACFARWRRRAAGVHFAWEEEGERGLETLGDGDLYRGRRQDAQ